MSGQALVGVPVQGLLIRIVEVGAAVEDTQGGVRVQGGPLGRPQPPSPRLSPAAQATQLLHQVGRSLALGEALLGLQ